MLDRGMKITIGISILLILLVGLFMIAEPSPNENNPDLASRSSEPSLLSTEKSAYDFGTISMKDGKVSTAYKVKNTSTEEVELEKIYTSCMCTEADLIRGSEVFGPYGMPGHGPLPRVGERLQPGEEVEVKVTYDPNAHGPAGVGPAERQIMIETDQGGPLQLSFSVNVTP